MADQNRNRVSNREAPETRDEDERRDEAPDVTREGDDAFSPHQASTRDPAEGAREIYAWERDELAYAERRDVTPEDLEKQRQRARGAGITNRPLAEEQREQQSLPERGERKTRTAR